MGGDWINLARATGAPLHLPGRGKGQGSKIQASMAGTHVESQESRRRFGVTGDRPFETHSVIVRDESDRHRAALTDQGLRLLVTR
jgi:hypothetical protein